MAIRAARPAAWHSPMGNSAFWAARAFSRRGLVQLEGVQRNQEHVPPHFLAVVPPPHQKAKTKGVEEETPPEDRRKGPSVCCSAKQRMKATEGKRTL